MNDICTQCEEYYQGLPQGVTCMCESDEDAHGDTSAPFTDMELQWFRGGVKVTDVINLVTNEDIVGETTTCLGCGAKNLQSGPCAPDWSNYTPTPTSDDTVGEVR